MEIHFHSRNKKERYEHGRELKETLVTLAECLGITEDIHFHIFDKNPKKGSKDHSRLQWHVLPDKTCLWIGPYYGRISTASLSCEALRKKIEEASRKTPNDKPLHKAMPTHKIHPDDKQAILQRLFAGTSGGLISRSEALSCLKEYAKGEPSLIIQGLLTEELLVDVEGELAFSSKASTLLGVGSDHPDLIQTNKPSSEEPEEPEEPEESWPAWPELPEKPPEAVKLPAARLCAKPAHIRKVLNQIWKEGIFPLPRNLVVHGILQCVETTNHGTNPIIIGLVNRGWIEKKEAYPLPYFLPTPAGRKLMEGKLQELEATNQWRVQKNPSGEPDPTLVAGGGTQKTNPQTPDQTTPKANETNQPHGEASRLWETAAASPSFWLPEIPDIPTNLEAMEGYIKSLKETQARLDTTKSEVEARFATLRKNLKKATQLADIYAQ